MLGVAGVVMPLVLFSGGDQAAVLIDQAAEYSVLYLTVLAVVKLLLTATLLMTGWTRRYCFLPYTTVMYMLVYSPTGIQGWDWMWIALGVLLDIMKWGQILNNRRGIPGYPADSQESLPPPESTAPPPTAA